MLVHYAWQPIEAPPNALHESFAHKVSKHLSRDALLFKFSGTHKTLTFEKRECFSGLFSKPRLVTGA
jgi:hypothetical protein